MTIAGGIFPLIIGPDAVNNLFIHSLTLCISFLLSFLFLSFPIFPPSPLFQPSSSPFCSFPSPPSSSLIPSPPAPLSLDAPSSLFRSAAAGERVATANHPSFLHPSPSFLPRTCSPHFHMFKHSHPVLATPPSSSSSSSPSFSPALLSSEF